MASCHWVQKASASVKDKRGQLHLWRGGEGSRPITGRGVTRAAVEVTCGRDAGSAGVRPMKIEVQQGKGLGRERAEVQVRSLGVPGS